MKDALSDTVFRETVRVEVVDVDRYGGTAESVWAVDVNANAGLTRQGLARVYRKYSRDPAPDDIDRKPRSQRPPRPRASRASHWSAGMASRRTNVFASRQQTPPLAATLSRP